MRYLKNTMCLFGAAVLLASCASLSRQPEDSLEAAARAEAQVVISFLSNQNRELVNYKGIGKIKVHAMVEHKPAVELNMMRTIKNALDPKGLMNPGKVL